MNVLILIYMLLMRKILKYFTFFSVPPKHLSINDLPNKSEIEVREAEKVVLQCQALSSKPATILKWYRKNIELRPGK